MGVVRWMRDEIALHQHNLLNVAGGFALFIDEWLWVGIALAAAGGLAVWAWREARRLFPEDSER